MNRFIFSLYIICLVQAQVPKNCVNSMVVNDIDSGGSYLAKAFDEGVTNQQQLEEQEQKLQQQHHMRHNQQNHHHHHHHHNTHRHHNVHHQADAHHHVDAGNHNDVEIGHTQPNMVKKNS